MTDSEQRLVDLVELYARAKGLAVSTVARQVFGSGDVVQRLRSGGSITIRRMDRGLRYLSTNWPRGLAWPADTPRPRRPR